MVISILSVMVALNGPKIRMDPKHLPKQTSITCIRMWSFRMIEMRMSHLIRAWWYSFFVMISHLFFIWQFNNIMWTWTGCWGCCWTRRRLVDCWILDFFRWTFIFYFSFFNNWSFDRLQIRFNVTEWWTSWIFFRNLKGFIFTFTYIFFLIMDAFYMSLQITRIVKFLNIIIFILKP